MKNEKLLLKQWELEEILNTGNVTKDEAEAITKKLAKIRTKLYVADTGFDMFLLLFLSVLAIGTALTVATLML